MKLRQSNVFVSSSNGPNSITDYSVVDIIINDDNPGFSSRIKFAQNSLFKKPYIYAKHCWLTSEILVTWEAEIRRIMV
jgi:hypothetical protein